MLCEHIPDLILAPYVINKSVFQTLCYGDRQLCDGKGRFCGRYGMKKVANTCTVMWQLTALGAHKTNASICCVELAFGPLCGGPKVLAAFERI